MDNNTSVSIMGLFISILSIIVSFSAIFISSRLVYNNNIRAYSNQIKVDCFRRLFASRYKMNSSDFQFALNECFVAFNGNGSISRQLQKLQRMASSSTGISNGELLDLIKLIIKDIDLDASEVDDEFLMTPFRVDG